MSKSDFDRELANTIWMKVKDKPLPKNYDNNQVEGIIKRYWHRAMESENYNDAR